MGADERPVRLVERHGVRAWADDAHAALQHVAELRQLVERGAAQEGADARDARIAARGLRHHGAVLLHAHRAELPDHDLFAAQAVAALADEGGAG